VSHARIVRRDVPADALAVDSDPLLDRVFRGRGVQSADELSFALKDLPPPEELAGMTRATELLVAAIQRQGRILIIGDYDADGATSTALAVCALRAMGAESVDYLLPNRFDYGYGLSPDIVRLAQGRDPELIVTVDNGIASVEGVALANEFGIQVLVTDHHLPPKVLPQADAIVNPNLDEDSSGCEHLAGVGVVFFVMLALRKQLRAQHWFATSGCAEPNLAELLDLVAIGTVADVVKLDAINRILVEQGMRRIRAGKTRPGVLALLEISKRSAPSLCSADLGFAVGPRLNAAGRLSDMTLGVKCLLAETRSDAMARAQQLDGLNRQRRDIEADMREEAEALLRAQPTEVDDDETRPALCLFEPHWHQGVIGILASRLKDALYRPVIVFASDGEQRLKGSGRSIPGVHLRDALDAVASAQPGLVQKFGGHAMAAGLTLDASQLDRFSAAFEAEVATRLQGVACHREFLTDGELTEKTMTLVRAEQLRFLAPWGQGFAAPSFDGEFAVEQVRVVGGKHLKMRLMPSGHAQAVDAIAFHQHEGVLPSGSLHVVYRLDVNDFRGSRSLQLIIDYFEPC